MIHGFKHQGNIDIPQWACTLNHYYWMIRVEGRDKVKKRRYYRYVAKEKLRLAELNINQDLIEAVCFYLAGLRDSAGDKVMHLRLEAPCQLKLDFTLKGT